jgi:hypothetical protein
MNELFEYPRRKMVIIHVPIGLVGISAGSPLVNNVTPRQTIPSSNIEQTIQAGPSFLSPRAD